MRIGIEALKASWWLQLEHSKMRPTSCYGGLLTTLFEVLSSLKLDKTKSLFKAGKTRLCHLTLLLDEEEIGVRRFLLQVVEKLLLADILVDESTKKSVKSVKIFDRHFEAL